MALRDVRITLRDRQTTGGSIPSDAQFGEPFVNLFDGTLMFSGVTGGSFEPSSQATIFESGSKLYNQKITNRLNINDNFIISGGTGLISTYAGTSGAGLVGKFFSGTSAGFVLGNISDIQGTQVYVQSGRNINTGGTASLPTINLVDSPSVNNITFSGTAIGGTIQAGAGTFTSLSAGTLSGGTLYSGTTNLYSIFQTVGATSTQVQPGTNITTGGTTALPTVNLVSSPSVNNITISGTTTGTIGNFSTLSATAITDSNLSSGQAVYASVGGLLKTNTGFTYDDAVSRLYAQNMNVGSPSLSGTMTVWGDIVMMGAAISAFTSQLYIEDNNIQLNYNPTADTTSTSLGAGWTIQDGSGSAGTDVLFDIRGTSTGVANRSFSTNLNDIRIRETGTVSAPNGVRVLAEFDVLDGGSY